MSRFFKRTSRSAPVVAADSVPSSAVKQAAPRTSRGRAMLEKIMPKKATTLAKASGVRFSLDNKKVTAPVAAASNISKTPASSRGASVLVNRAAPALRREPRGMISAGQGGEREYVANLMKRASAQLEHVSRTCVHRNGVMSRHRSFRHVAELRGIGGSSKLLSRAALQTRVQAPSNRQMRPSASSRR